MPPLTFCRCPLPLAHPHSPACHWPLHQPAHPPAGHWLAPPCRLPTHPTRGPHSEPTYSPPLRPHSEPTRAACYYTIVFQENNTYWICLIVVFFIFIGIVVNGLVNVSISTIEKRFELNSSLTGVISASYDIAFCVLSLFVSFFGERGHKPRWLAFSSFMIGLGSFVFALPHFAGGIYQYGSKLEGKVCCAHYSLPLASSSLSSYLYVFILAQLLLGVGGTPLYTLGTAFIDDSVPKHKSSLYIGIGYAMSLLGPALGYVLGGQLLNIYIDIDPDDPRWLGAWWIAFLLCCFATWLLIVPFSCFPKHLPGKLQSEKISETHNDGSEAFVEDRNIGKNFKDFPVALLILLKNPVLMCLIVAASTEALVATGFATFLPKFIENQFGQSSSYSATLGGLVLIPGAALGQIISGILVSKYKLDCKNIIKFMLGTCLVALLLNTVFLFSKCGNEPFAGVSETYNRTGKLRNLSAPCNANCSCLRSFYYPVCGRDEVQYFSPCFAGCTSFTVQKRKKVFFMLLSQTASGFQCTPGFWDLLMYLEIILNFLC
uniref:Solute carrier organic anion transporter family member n=1 Tax=Chelydra serpentina TaxID=8475 RepID=A0A8C3XS78_CHESE